MIVLYNRPKTAKPAMHRAGTRLLQGALERPFQRAPEMVFAVTKYQVGLQD
jgi:hypothetical protein